MRTKPNTYQLSKLIYRSVSQTIKRKQKKRLQQWLEIDDNQALFDQITQNESIINKKLLYKQSNKEKVFEKILKKIKLKEQQKFTRKKYLNVFKYAATILILITAGNYIYKTSFSQEAITQKAIKNIKPGYEKATLILSDGTEVNLEENKNKTIASTNTVTVENTNEGLVYKQIKETSETTSNAIAEAEIEVKYNTLRIPVGGMHSVELPDGTRVWLNSASTLTFPTSFNGDQRIVTLNGEAYFDVTKSSKEFIVETNSVDITVLGTEFNISAYKDDADIATTLVEGKVKMTGTNNSVILTPNKQGFISAENATIEVKHVDVEVFTAWKEGKFYFERESLDKILAKMSRWYNIDILFEDTTIKHETFTGVVLKNKPIDFLLNSICITTSLTYNINKNQETEKYEVIISRK